MAKVTIALDAERVANLLNALDEAHLVVSIAKSYSLSDFTGKRYAKVLDGLTELFGILEDAETDSEVIHDMHEEKALGWMRQWGVTLARDEAQEDDVEYGKDLISAYGGAAALDVVLGIGYDRLMEAVEDGKAAERERARELEVRDASR